MKYDKNTAKAILRKFDPDIEIYDDNAYLVTSLAIIALLAEIRDLLIEMKDERIEESIKEYIKENY